VGWSSHVVLLLLLVLLLVWLVLLLVWLVLLLVLLLVWLVLLLVWLVLVWLLCCTMQALHKLTKPVAVMLLLCFLVTPLAVVTDAAVSAVSALQRS
jgi:hypothetical protein